MNFTVSQLTSLIRNTLESSFFGLKVDGEISTFRPSSTGHWYFSLKDDNALINAVVWKNTTSSIGFVPHDGQKVTVTGYISVFAPRGTYQLVCTSMHLSGDGDILAKLEERKRYYASKGYFDQNRKKDLPANPKKIAVITSPTGAALQDILQITERRNSSVNIIILPATVQGEGAGATIAKRIKQVNDFLLADVIIVGRGGGSIEDLLPFSEDCVIEAIYNSEIPIVSAVGHEIDWALSDYVADLRAPTPSAAAELVCPNQDNQKQVLQNIKDSMTDAVNSKITNIKFRLTAVNPASSRYNIENRITQLHLQLESSLSVLSSEIENRLFDLRTRLNLATSIIKATSPLEVLKRGYSIVSDNTGKTVKTSDKLQEKQELKIQFAKGFAKVTVKEQFSKSEF